MGYELRARQAGCEQSAGFLAADMGYGHWRAIRAAAYGLQSVDLPLGIDIVNFTHFSSKALATYWKLEDMGLAWMYRHPKFLGKVKSLGGERGTATLTDRFPRILDNGHLHSNLDGNYSPLIAGHTTPSALLEKPHITLVCDPEPSLYLNYNPHATFIVVDRETGERLRELRQEKRVPTEYVVVGPMVAPEIVHARANFEKRKEELLKGAPLRITIATGGSHTHAEQIIALAEAYARSMLQGAPIEELNIVVGNGRHLDSKKMHEAISITKDQLLHDVAQKIKLIQLPDSLELVSAADEAMGRSDVIHGKTGELVYTVAGGKVFHTLTPAGLAHQENCLARFAHLVTKEGIEKIVHRFLISELNLEVTDDRYASAKKRIEAFLNRRYEHHFGSASGTVAKRGRATISSLAFELIRLAGEQGNWPDIAGLENEIRNAPSALALGHQDPSQEVQTILEQHESGALIHRMTLGTQMSADGPLQLGEFIRKMYFN